MRRTALLVLAGLVIIVVATVLLTSGGEPDGPRTLAGATKPSAVLTYDEERREELEARAADGLAHVLYAKSPGGALATAQRVAALRGAVERAAGDGAVVDADTLEGIVVLESAGRPDVLASDDLRGAAGLTQILAQTATGLLGMRVDVVASTRLTSSLERTRSPARRRTLEARRRAVDERFDPDRALAATVRYLAIARGHLGRADLAVVSYHMGIGNLQRALRAYGTSDVPYARLFFDSSPLRHAPAWDVLATLGDDSSTYLWRVRAAEQLMALWRRDPEALSRRAGQQLEAASAERVLRPTATTPRLHRDGDLDTDALAVVTGDGLRVSRALAEAPARERALRPSALAVLRLIAAGVRDVSRTAPLVVTAAGRSVEGEEDDLGLGAEAPPSTHTTGWAFDISRDYRTPEQAQALQFWLDRLTALDVIAWTREDDHIHVVVGPRADAD